MKDIVRIGFAVASIGFAAALVVHSVVSLDGWESLIALGASGGWLSVANHHMDKRRA